MAHLRQMATAAFAIILTFTLTAGSAHAQVGTVSALATKDFNYFPITLMAEASEPLYATPPLSSSQQCYYMDGASVVQGPFAVSVDLPVTAVIAFNLSLGQHIQVISPGNYSSIIKGSNQQNVQTLTIVSDEASSGQTVQLALMNAAGQMCEFGVSYSTNDVYNLQTGLDTSYPTFSATAGSSNFTAVPTALPNLLYPNFPCNFSLTATNGTTQVNQNALTIAVDLGVTTTVNFGVANLYITESTSGAINGIFPTNAPGILSVSGQPVTSITFTAGTGVFPATVNMNLGAPQTTGAQCFFGVNFVPNVASSSPSTPPVTTGRKMLQAA